MRNKSKVGEIKLKRSFVIRTLPPQKINNRIKPDETIHFQNTLNTLESLAAIKINHLRLNWRASNLTEIPQLVIRSSNYIATIQTKCHPGATLTYFVLQQQRFPARTFSVKYFAGCSNIIFSYLPGDPSVAIRPVFRPRAEERESTDMGAANNAALITLEPGQEDRGNFLGDPCSTLNHISRS